MRVGKIYTKHLIYNCFLHVHFQKADLAGKHADGLTPIDIVYDRNDFLNHFFYISTYRLNMD